MKKWMGIGAILTVAALSAAPAEAQTQGQFWIGGSVGFESSKEQGDLGNTRPDQSPGKNEVLLLTPEIGYAFSDRWAVGVRLDLIDGKIVTNPNISPTPSETTDTDSWSIAPFVRYTGLRWKAFSLFVDGGLFYARQETETMTVTTTNYTTTFSGKSAEGDRYGLFLHPGFSLRLVGGLALTGHISLLEAGFGETTHEATNVSSFDDSFNSISTWLTKTKDRDLSLNSPFDLGNFTVGLTYAF